MRNLSLVLILMFFVAACNNAGSSGQSNTAENAQEPVFEVAVINVSGMHCTGCENAITNSLTKMDGVSEASATYTEQKATVKFDPSKVTMEEMKAAIEDKGYGVVDYEIIEPEK